MIRHLRLAIAAAVTALACAAATPSLAQSGPFAGLSGVWNGSGTIALSDGSQERIRCRSTYATNKTNDAMNLNLVCASDSYKFDLRGSVESDGRAVAGNWTEASRNISGQVEGRAGRGQFDVVVSAPGFTANLSLATRGNKQSIGISSQSEFRTVTIALTRS